jgi:hypothetical protein
VPNINTSAHVLVRDRFTCRYCGARLYLAQAVKVLAMHKPGIIHWDAHWRTEPLNSHGATVDHIVPEDDGGYDTFDNLVACCVACNSSKGSGERNLLPRSLDESWDGGSRLFLTLAPMYRSHLSKSDEKWVKALKREGFHPYGEDVQARIDALLLTT